MRLLLFTATSEASNKNELHISKFKWPVILRVDKGFYIHLAVWIIKSYLSLCLQTMRPPTRLDLTINHFIIVNADENVGLNLLVFFVLFDFASLMLPSVLVSVLWVCFMMYEIALLAEQYQESVNFFHLHQEIAFETL